MSTKPDPEQTKNRNENQSVAEEADPSPPPLEKGGPSGPEPTRFGDWSIMGRTTDF